MLALFVLLLIIMSWFVVDMSEGIEGAEVKWGPTPIEARTELLGVITVFIIIIVLNYTFFNQ